MRTLVTKAMKNGIDELELSVRAYNCLRRAGYGTIESVISHINGRDDLLKLRNMGRKSADEFMLKLFLYTYESLEPEKQKAYLERVRSMND